MSVALCGVCNTQVSRYKCPACNLPYCSLTCYKPHKASHTTSDAPPNDETRAVASTTASTIDAATPHASASTVELPAYPPKAAAPLSFSGLTTSSAFTNLVSADPSLKAKLHAIYKVTLPSTDVDLSNSTDRNARYTRGSARGRYGQRGRYDNRRHEQRGPWTQARADERAVAMIAEERSKEGDEGAMAEFIRVVGRVCGGGEDVDAGSAEVNRSDG